MEKRISLWDNLKIFLIYTVVLGHFVDVFTSVSGNSRSIFVFCYAFHMPAFIFVSGLFHKNTDIKRKFLLYTSISLVLKMVLSLFNAIVSKGVFSFNLLSEADIPWFMFALACYIVICYLLRNQNKVFVLLFSVILACFVGYDKSIGDFLCLSRIIVFFPFYYAGTVLDHKKIVEFREKHRFISVLGIVILLIFLYVCFFRLEQIYPLRYLFTGRNPYRENPAVKGILLRLLCYGISTIVTAALIFVTPKNRIPVITDLGNNTLTVYFWHWPLYRICTYFIDFKTFFDMGLLCKIIYVGVLPLLFTFILARFKVFSYPIEKLKQIIK
ncbi:MAG: acyltransferase family protein [Acutalibacteraceae bacterium]|nr:acyltransferase family protein [Acutalibacteraceae bacterium]